MFLRRRQTTTIDAVLAQLARDDGRGELAWSQRLPAEAPVYAESAVLLAPALERALAEMGIRRLYAHQAVAIEQIRAGGDLVIVTPTASGKTLAFNPVPPDLMQSKHCSAAFFSPIASKE